MKRQILITMVIMLLLPISIFSQNYPLRVIITPKQKFPSNLAIFKERPSDYISISVVNTAEAKDIYFELKLQQLTPSRDKVVQSNKDIKPLKGIQVKARGNTALKQNDLTDNFATHNFSDFQISGADITSVNDVLNAIVLPEGTYSICLIAYDYNTPLGEPPMQLSDPNNSCTIVNVCNSAKAPKWIEPVQCLNEIDCENKVVNPTRNIRFSWLPTMNTCGINLGKVKYEIKLVPVYEGQTADEAINLNSPKNVWYDINSTSLIVDTNTLQNIFNIGEKYALQVSVKEDIVEELKSKIDFENNGKSKAVSFIYGEKPIAENNEDANNEKEDKNEKDKPKQEIDRDIQLVLTNVDCGVPLPAKQIPIESLSPKDEVMIDKFPLIIKEVQRNDSTKLFKGTGIIRKPIVGDFEYFNWVNVLVEFDSLAVNTDKQVFGGFARAVYSKELNTDFREFFKSFDSWPNWAQKYCGIGANKGVEQAQKSAKKYVEKFQGEANVVMQMFNLSYQSLPIKISHNIAGYDFDVAISDMKFTPKGSVFSLLYFMKIPEVDQVLPFGIRNVCMNGNPIQNGDFCLLADVEIPLGGDNKKMVLRGGIPSGGEKARTYIKWSRNGFEGVSLDAAIRFYKGSGITNVDESKQFVDISLSTEFLTWDDWMANISMDEFKIDGVPDFTFNVSNAVYDHSTKKNHEKFSEATKALSKYDADLTNSTEFTGVFIGELACKAKLFADEKPVKFYINNTLINSNGISFVAGASNILDIETGHAGGWQFSIDNLNLVLVNNVFREGNINGRMKIPLNENESEMTYHSVLSYPKGGKLEYKLSVVPNISYNFLKYFTAKLSKTSTIDLIVNSENVIVDANFNGELRTQDCLLNFELASFQNMKISNWDEKNKKQDFVFSFGDWGFSALDKAKSTVSEVEDILNSESIENKDAETKGAKSASGKKGKKSATSGGDSKKLYSVSLGPFEASIGQITPLFKNIEVTDASSISEGLQRAKEKGNLRGVNIGLRVGLGVHLGFGEANMAGGDLTSDFTFDVLYDSKFKTSPKLSKFNYKVNSVSVDGEFGPVAINGSLDIFDGDPTYGDGAKGEITCKFPMDITAEAQVYFGKKKKSNDEYSKYFCVYGGLELGQASIPLFEPLELSGFGMGVWKNMQAKDDPSKPSGLSFEPMDGNDNGWGFKGEVLFGFNEAAGGKNSLTASAAISGQIKGGSLQSIQFLGKVSSLGTFNGELAKAAEKLSEIMDDKGGINKNYCVNGELKLEYNPSKKQFFLQANCNAELLIAQAKGSINMFIDGNNKIWYVAAGIPDYDSDSILRAEAEFDIPGVNFNSLFKGYFIIGNHLTYQMPPIPEKILELVKEKPSRSWPKNTAAGFFMGCRFSLNFEFKFGPLFAGLESMIGFDMSVKNEKGRTCADGREIKGMKGYYLRGQLYAYFSGKVGVELKFFGKNRKWNLCAISCAGYLRGAMPSPTYLKGAIGVKGEILGGLIKFNTNAKFTLGNECQPPGGDPLKDFNLVEDVDPGYDTKSEAEERASKKPSIFVSPKVRFSAPINKPFDLFDENENRRTYVFQHVRSEVRNVTGGDPVLLSTKTNNMISNKKEYYNELSYKFTEKLKPHTIYEFTIVCKVQEIVNGNYRNPIDGEGKYYSDNETMVTKTVYFKTDNLPNRIEPDNIRNAYPVNRQFETFVKDGEKGYIVLEYEQRNLIDKVATELGKDALFGVFKNRTNRNKPDILFHYEYKKNSNIGNEKKDAVIFDLKNLDKGCIYEVEFFVAEKFDKAATYQTKKITEKIGDVSDRSGKSSSGVKIIRTSSGKVIKIIQRDSQEETSDEDIVSYTGIVDVDKFSNSMKIDTSFAGKKTNTYQNSVNLNSANRANFIKQVLAQNLDAVDIPDGVNIDASSRFASISKNDGSNFKGAVRKGSDSKYDNLQSRNIMESKFADTSKIDKQKEEKTNIGAKAVIKSIFKYHFRTSGYDNLEQKMKNVSAAIIKRENNSSIQHWSSSKHQNIPINITAPESNLFKLYFPPLTTYQEVFGGKSFEESSNAIYRQPNLSIKVDLKNEESSVVGAWKRICMPFLNIILRCCSFNLPTTANINPDYDFYKAMVNYLRGYDPGYSNTNFRGRLTDEEIWSGRSHYNPYDKNNETYLSYAYLHYSTFYRHLFYASKVADEIVVGGRNITPKDLHQSTNYINIKHFKLSANSILDLNVCEIRYFSDRFLRDASDYLRSYLSKDRKTFNEIKGDWIKGKNHNKLVKYLKKKTSYTDYFDDGGYSTLFALRSIWQEASKRKFDFRSKDFMFYPIGKHDMLIFFDKDPLQINSSEIKHKIGEYNISH